MSLTFDYNQTMKQAKLMEELANDIKKQCDTKLNEISSNIEAAWSGQAAKTYCKYVSGVRIDLLNKAKYMQQIAEFLRSAASKMKSAEDTAKQIVNKI